MSEQVPQGWDNTTIGQAISEIADGGTPATSNLEFFGGSIPWVVIDDIKPRITHTKSSITDLGLQKSSAKLWNKGTIILSTGATIGKVGVAMKAMATKQGICGIVPKDNVFVKYFYYLLASKKCQLNILSQGSTIKETRPSIIKKIEIYLPPLPEQKKIASILTSVDEVIEKTQKEINKLQDLKKGTMNELLTKGIGHTEFKDSELGRIPKSWEVKRMSLIAQVIDSLHETPNFSNFGVPMVRVTDIKRGNLSLENAKTVSEEDYLKFIKKYEPKLGDIVMSRVGSYGVSSYVASDKPFCMGQNTVIINPLGISGRFLYECLESNCIQKQIELEVAGSGYKSLSLADIRTLMIPVPPEREQEQIKNLLLSIDGQVTAQKQKLAQTQSLKKSLMQDLLTGKVRVSVN